jgi:transposase-like protein
VFSREFKVAAVERVLKGESIRAVAVELTVRRKLIYEWKDRYAQLGAAGLGQAGRPRREAVLAREPGANAETSAGRGELLAARKRIAELERKVGQQELELDFFGEALRRVRAVEDSAKNSARLSPDERGKAD